jgi:hypothetical protein
MDLTNKGYQNGWQPFEAAFFWRCFQNSGNLETWKLCPLAKSFCSKQISLDMNKINKLRPQQAISFHPRRFFQKFGFRAILGTICVLHEDSMLRSGYNT